MSRIEQFGYWLIAIASVAVLPSLGQCQAPSRDQLVNELLLGIATPAVSEDRASGRALRAKPAPAVVAARTEPFDDSLVERLLQPRFPAPTVLGEQNGREAEALFKADSFYPGSVTLQAIREEFLGRASLHSTLSAAKSNACDLLDPMERLQDAGCLVAQPTKLYRSFEIHVSHSQFALRLYALNERAERVVLYECQVGLGSPEYPTPKGSFYITRIFDDNPWWIPPDRDWAYGERASRNIYGGHMMPFFTKIPLSPRGVEADEAEEWDCVASRVKMVDSGMYRIHGTNSPWSVGSDQSHGCVRMLNSTVKALSDTLKLYVGMGQRGESANGAFVTLTRPVRLLLY